MDDIKLYAVKYEVRYESTYRCFIFSNEADAQIKYSTCPPWEGHCDNVVLVGPFSFGLEVLSAGIDEIPVIARRAAVQDY